MASSKLIKGPFQELEKFSTLESLINYIQNQIEIKQIRCYVANSNKEEIPNSTIIENIEIDALDNKTILDYKEDVRKRVEFVLEESLYISGSSNITRYHYLALQLMKIEEIVEFYTDQNPLSNHLSKIDVIEIYNESEMKSNFSFMTFNSSLLAKVLNSFNTRLNLLGMVHRLIMTTAIKFGDDINPDERSYGWKKIGDSNKATNPEYEIYELAFALSNSEKLEFYNGNDRRLFIKHFLNFFNLPPNKISKLHSQLTERSKEYTPFLEELIDNVKIHKPTSARQKASIIKNKSK